MKLFHNIADLETIKGKYIFVDNDAFSVVFRDKEVFSEFRSIMKLGWPTLDPFTRFEFRRDIGSPERREIVDRLIASRYFVPIIHHPSTFIGVENNALLLSRIYRHNGVNLGWSTVDLLIAGRIMYYTNTSVLITGNKKDFPSCIFDTIAVLNIEDEKGSIKPLSVIKFNKDKFENCFNSYKKSEIKSKKIINSSN